MRKSEVSKSTRFFLHILLLPFFVGCTLSINIENPKSKLQTQTPKADPSGVLPNISDISLDISGTTGLSSYYDIPMLFTGGKSTLNAKVVGLNSGNLVKIHECLLDLASFSMTCKEAAASIVTSNITNINLTNLNYASESKGGMVLHLYQLQVLGENNSSTSILTAAELTPLIMTLPAWISGYFFVEPPEIKTIQILTKNTESANDEFEIEIQNLYSQHSTDSSFSLSVYASANCQINTKVPDSSVEISSSTGIKIKNISMGVHQYSITQKNSEKESACSNSVEYVRDTDAILNLSANLIEVKSEIPLSSAKLKVVANVASYKDTKVYYSTANSTDFVKLSFLQHSVILPAGALEVEIPFSYVSYGITPTYSQIDIVGIDNPGSTFGAEISARVIVTPPEVGRENDKITDIYGDVSHLCIKRGNTKYICSYDRFNGWSYDSSDTYTIESNNGFKQFTRNCYIDGDDYLYCIDSNNNTTLMDATTKYKDTAGRCGLTDAGKLHCWDFSLWTSPVNPLSKVELFPTETFLKLAVQHSPSQASCALGADEKIYCFDSTGVGGLTNKGLGTEYREIYQNYNQLCGITKTDGQLYCDMTESSYGTLIAPGSEFDSISIGAYNTYIGYDRKNGAYKNGGLTNSTYTNIHIEPNVNVTKAVYFYSSICYLSDSGLVVCQDEQFSLSKNRSDFRLINEGQGFKSISGDHNLERICAVTTVGDLLCASNDAGLSLGEGPLLDGLEKNINYFINMNVKTKFKKVVSLGKQNVFAISEDDMLWYSGRVKDSSKFKEFSEETSLGKVKKIDGNCALTQAGKISCYDSQTFITLTDSRVYKDIGVIYSDRVFALDDLGNMYEFDLTNTAGPFVMTPVVGGSVYTELNNSCALRVDKKVDCYQYNNVTYAYEFQTLTHTSLFKKLTHSACAIDDNDEVYCVYPSGLLVGKKFKEYITAHNLGYGCGINLNSKLECNLSAYAGGMVNFIDLKKAWSPIF